VPPGDAGALAGAVRDVLDDAGERDRLRAAARARAAQLPTGEDAVRQVREIYARLAGTRRSR
jgi:glycosyltransferase involved in cell wall biosynthesis